MSQLTVQNGYHIIYGIKFIWQGDREREKTKGFAVCTRAVRLYADWRRSRRCRIANAAYAVGHYAFSTKPTRRGYQLFGISDMENLANWQLRGFSVSTDRGKGHLGADIYPE